MRNCRPAIRTRHWKPRLPTRPRSTLEAWRRRGLDGTTQFGSNQVPAKMFASLFSVEFLIHAWDFATATDREVVVSEPLAEYVMGMASSIITPQIRGGGSFDEPVQAGPDAGILDRLIAFTGRQRAVIHAN